MSKNALSLAAMAMLAVGACAPATLGTAPDDPEVQATVSATQAGTSGKASKVLQKGPKSPKECQDETRLRAWANGDREQLIGMASIGETKTPFKTQAAKDWKAADDAAIDEYLAACANGEDPEAAEKKLYERLRANRWANLRFFSRVQM